MTARWFVCIVSLLVYFAEIAYWSINFQVAKVGQRKKISKPGRKRREKIHQKSINIENLGVLRHTHTLVSPKKCWIGTQIVVKLQLFRFKNEEKIQKNTPNSYTTFDNCVIFSSQSIRPHLSTLFHNFGVCYFFPSVFSSSQFCRSFIFSSLAMFIYIVFLLRWGLRWNSFSFWYTVDNIDEYQGREWKCREGKRVRKSNKMKTKHRSIAIPFTLGAVQCRLSLVSHRITQVP